MFFILVHSDFFGIPPPDHVSYTKYSYLKFHTTRYYKHSFLKKWRRAIVKSEHKMANYRNQKLCFYCKRFNHQQDECGTRMQDNQPCTDSKGRKYWPK
jgi:hypothetical protein